MEFEQRTLHNGIQIVHKRVSSPVAHCCILINAGTRDELDNEHGIAHFIEHVLFKGTKKRRAFHIMSRLEDVGGELNAYTTKEETVIHASFLKQDFNRAMELITDIAFHATFPEKEIAKEKEVVIDEINSYKDSPYELIFDDFEELIYPNHPFGRNILGTKNHVSRFNRKGIAAFISRCYNTDQMVFCSVGDIPFTRVSRLADKYLNGISANKRSKPRLELGNYRPQDKIIKKSTFQTHCIIGTTAYDLQNPKRIAMHLLNNILGGPGMNSRLNLALREKHGFAYNVESSYTPYTDTGVFTIYFGTDKANVEKSHHEILKELARIREQRMGVMQLFKAKRQLIGQTAIAADSNENLMLSAAKSFMVYQKPEDLTEVFNRIENISSSDILEVANEILSENRLSTLIYR
ncbi:MAG TPA: pitrilysin family protein [Tenuifilaceae bacterium]|nr:pitrilysin family protein [Tenuifilaceae bacterium]HPA68122.1 pitrilysin family protein [Tenuifilaceae bacterium]HQQ29224.1 pitrilysin family protein [Tenuifilaceae bacterium]HRC93854.1 pitrilysin family protein [Tenuifilaceae bacterium]